MAAPEGNQFWKRRSKHGRNALFASPQLLWEAACEYFKWVDDNPFIEYKPMITSSGNNTGSTIEMAEIPVKQPYTLHGFCIYCGVSTSYFRAFKLTADKSKHDFLTIISEIEDIIYQQKFSGAAAGFFNANIIARDLGLRDQSDVNVTDSRKNVDDLFPTEEDFNNAGN